MYAWLRRPVPGLRVPRGDLLLALALSVATLWLAVQEVGDARAEQAVRFPWNLDGAGPGTAGPAPARWARLPAEEDQNSWLASLNLIATLPLAVRRFRPMAAFAVQFAGVFAARDTLTVFSLVALLVGAATAAAAASRPVLVLGVLTAMAAVLAASFADATPNIPNGFAPFALLLPVGLGGIALRAARLRGEAYRQSAEAAARERDRAARLAVAEERARIARELHDVVSHHVSVMTIQAGAAAKVLDREPELARGAIAAVESSGREAMGELRQLLSLLTPSVAEGGAAPDGDGPLSPQPGLGQIPALAESVRAAGQPVGVSVPDGLSVPTSVGLAAYRVVQEALTNALRYAPGARIDVCVRQEGEELVIDVANQAPPVPVRVSTARAPAGDSGSGTGLIGLAERLRLCGGTFTARPLAGGGFRVYARIPLEQP